MQALLDQLAQHVILATAEKAAAEQREKTARAVLAQAQDRVAAAAHRRTVLADMLETAETVAEAAATRMGAARSSLAETLREVDTVADRVVEGGGDAKTLTRLQDVAASQRAVVEAHERRAAAAEADRAQAEQQLVQHDIEQTDSTGVELEQLMVDRADEVDQRLDEIIQRAVQVFAVVDARRQQRPREPWPCDLQRNEQRFAAILAAFEHSSWTINPQRLSVGTTGAKSFAYAVGQAVHCWKQGRKEAAIRARQAA